MKELSIEEKAKAYDEAIKRAKDSFNYPDYPGFIRADVVFPELKDNDDNIRKEIINYFKCQNREEPSRKDIHNKWIAWLEKQGNKSVNIDIESMVSSYKQRVLSQSNGVRNNPLINMCLSAFRRGIENTLDKLHLKQCEQKSSMEGTFVNVDEVREDFMQEVYRVLDADTTNDRANQIIDAFDNLPTIAIQKPTNSSKDDGFDSGHAFDINQKW